MEDKKYYYSNPETGEMEEVSKETYDRIRSMRQLFTTNGGKVGRIFIAGTAGGGDDGDMRKLWNESNQK